MYQEASPTVRRVAVRPEPVDHAAAIEQILSGGRQEAERVLREAERRVNELI